MSVSKPQSDKACLNALKQFLSTDKAAFGRGIEKEGLRTDNAGFIAQTDHPSALGHTLTHPHITTDYSEALLELITDVHTGRDTLLKQLGDVHQFVQENLGDEQLWAGSMPCALDGDQSIRIAEYGDSNIGQLKHVYRQGLGVRYGRIMQSIAGLHFNFSLNDELWQALHDAENSELSLQDYKSAKYFALIRNFRRHAWLLMYLFGASPALDQSFIKPGAKHSLEQFDDKGTLYLPYACSLRMGDLGYHNNAQSDLSICFNTVDNFVATLQKAIKTPYQAYEEIGTQKDGQYIQLNTNILQIENEYYSPIRPKRTAQPGEKPTEALRARGVEYVEVRCMDLNPMLPLGISETEIDFLDLFLLNCLVQPSDWISDDDCLDIESNFSAVVNRGREPDLTLVRKGETLTLKSWGLQLIQEMEDLLPVFGQGLKVDTYATALDIQKQKLLDSSLCPSAQVLEQMRTHHQSWLNLVLALSRQHKKTLTEEEALSEQERASFQQEAERSLKQAAAIKASDNQDFAAYLADYIA